MAYDELPTGNDAVFAVEYLPGQYDQRADAAGQCIALIAGQEAPVVRTARVYLLEGFQTSAELDAIKRYVINPVEAREASLTLPGTLALPVNEPERVGLIEGFRDFDKTRLLRLQGELSLAMDLDDL